MDSMRIRSGRGVFGHNWYILITSLPEAQGHQGSGDGRWIGVRGRGGLLWVCCLDVTESSHSRTHSSSVYLPKACTRSSGLALWHWWRKAGMWELTPRGEHSHNWWLLGKEESFFFRVWPLVGCLYISGWPHSHAHASTLIRCSGLKTNHQTKNPK